MGNNKTYSVADWSIMINAVLLIIILMLGCDDYRLRHRDEVKTISAIDSKEEIQFKKRNDSIIMAADIKKEISTREIIASKNRMKKNAEKIELLRDTVSKTIDSSQFEITKKLCINAKNEGDLKEINYCLLDGKEAKDNYREAKIQLEAKDTIISQQKVIIDAKDSCINRLNVTVFVCKEDNLRLNDKIEKVTHKKKIWRNIAVGAVSALVVTLALLF